jgi:hypothetical protein
MKWRHSLLILVSGAGTLLVVGALVAALATHQPEATYRPNTPEYTVATFYRLLQQGKVDQAYDMTAPWAYSYFNGPAEFHGQLDNWSQTSHRVTLVSTSSNADHASVTVDISALSSSPLGPIDQTCRKTITLERHDGTWQITGPTWFGC